MYKTTWHKRLKQKKRFVSDQLEKKSKRRLNTMKKVKTQYFTLNNLLLLKDLTLNLRKLIEQWRGLFIIDNFGENHSAFNILKTLNRIQYFIRIIIITCKYFAIRKNICA